MEAGEYGLTRGTRFVACCLEVIAVAGLIGFRGVFSVGQDFLFYRFYLHFFLRTHTACCKYEVPLPQLSLY